QRGFGRQALAWLVEHLASDPDVRRLRATVDPRNVASLALLRGAGFAVVAEVAGDPGDVVLARAP
ncbi:MAG: GNAT family N-acetyltransferase, partial [Kofleriaceae bacterium]|nr:GNAT family N-acetyltransferase [Kofleriaceae bacterium]